MDNQKACMELTWALCIYVTVLYLGLLVELPTLGAGAVSDSLNSIWDPIPHTGFPCPALIQGEISRLTSPLICHVLLISMGGLPCAFLNGNGGGVDGGVIAVAIF